MTLIEPEIRDETTNIEDVERLTHIIQPAVGDTRDAATIVTEARVLGLELTALCGKKWIPEHNPERFPLCETCVEIWEKRRGKPFPGRR